MNGRREGEASSNNGDGDSYSNSSGGQQVAVAIGADDSLLAVIETRDSGEGK